MAPRNGVAKRKPAASKATKEKQVAAALMAPTPETAVGTENPGAGPSTAVPDEGPVYFWRETHPATGYLSQWYACPFHDPKDPSKIYRTAEHYMMHHKALLFGDAAIAAKVLVAGHPRTVKGLGRKVKNFDEAVWVRERLRIVEQGTVAKFTCATVDETELKRGSGANAAKAMDVGESLRSLLLSTGDRELVEASPFDRIWGVGFTAENAKGQRENWGENLLGKALMAVRESFRREDAETKEGK